MNPFAGRLLAGAALVIGCAVAATLTPLWTYAVSLALFGLPHVLVELRYVDERFAARLPRRTTAWLLLGLVCVAALRALTLVRLGDAGTRVTAELLVAAASVALVLPLLAITRLGLYLIGVRTRPAPDTAEVQKQILAAVEDSTSDLPLADTEREWIGNIVGLKDLQVSTIMTPRPDIIAFPESMPLREVIEQALEQGFSRYPIYRERIDEIIGVFYVKDALKLLHARHTGEIDGDLTTMLREPLFVPETMGAAQLLHRFQAGNLHMAIVLDEYGTTAGIVSVEDVLEEIVGEIGDEYDSPVDGEIDPEQIQVLEEGKVLEIPARATVADLNEMLDAQLPDDGDWETVAGMVIAALNHIPKVDETVQIHGVEFRVLDADERRLKRLRVTTLAGAAKDAG
ncbi:MAG: HlyC/CorC family transporter [Planctomycetes bacterium]|nr:HlyC/CorC family transporter [Planctomycetota bacterium]